MATFVSTGMFMIPKNVYITQWSLKKLKTGIHVYISA